MRISQRLKVLIRVACAIVAGYILTSVVLSMLISVGIFRWEIICHRAPLLLVDVEVSSIEGIDYVDHRYGHNQHGEYIGFWPDAEIGDKVVSLMVFSPWNNYCDDVAERFDVAVWH